MLELDALRYHAATAPEPVLRGASLRIEPGQIALVAGRSGSGKSTLLELICGLADPSQGVIRWHGKAINARQRRWLCGLVFQFPERHFLGLTVGQELRLGQRRLPSEKAEAVLQQVDLSGLSFQQAPEELSGGQQRRLAMAVQLLRDPKVLLMDEPTAGLDWSVRSEIIELIGELSRDRIVLIVTHEPELFESLTQPDQRWTLRDGQLQPALIPC
ncbi:ABC transporter ATP-binding protein [Synechococcus sp. LTW-R]|uniref:ABC transporter ATP-binding protein n=1 Tax=Synechococcus sp. LTW-R TaxID=2751170 RepID=UPI001623AF17|nr:ABC transporter ATP-binding protein [Synechococcus sp. LTW-R]QNG30417.1 ABC transporter ATP-binding protein [Synechococcus sp. LTW-R]